MNIQYDKIGEGTSELAENFEKESVRLALDLSHGSGWFGVVRKSGDLTLDWYVRARESYFPENDVSIYQGAALIRDGKVHFYDRYPLGGGPFKVSDFTSPDFKRRAEIISDNIERLLKE